VLDEAELLGANADPLASWLLLRGLRTLSLRMEQHQASAQRVARFLATHPRVQRVYYPGLEDHPAHTVARRQLRGFSSLFSFALREQTRAAVQRFLDRLKIFGIGCSWGGYESLALGGPAGTLFSDDPAEPSWIIRLHVGLESVDDLLADLRQALED
jgi:cystathionine beta-lyase/cystathionine gamma-synthase